MGGLYQEILDREELQRLQDQFCTVAGVYAFCVDYAGNDVTDMSGDEAGKERIAGLVSKEEMLSLFRRLSESSLEDQAVEDTESDALKYAAVCVKEEGKTVLAWLVCGVLSDAESSEGKEFAREFHCRTTERQFNLALDLLRAVMSA